MLNLSLSSQIYLIFFSFLAALSYGLASSNELGKNSGAPAAPVHPCELPENEQLCVLKHELDALRYEIDERLNGGDVADQKEKRKSAFVRFGKRALDFSNEKEKRKSAFVRFGRSSSDAMENMDDSLSAPEKRKSAFVRFGKRKSAFVRFGRSGADDLESLKSSDEKRKSSYIRFG